MVDKIVSFDAQVKGHKKVTIVRVSRRNQIKGLLGSNFVSIRTCGDKLELITKTDIQQTVRQEIEAVWKVK